MKEMEGKQDSKAKRSGKILTSFLMNPDKAATRLWSGEDSQKASNNKGIVEEL